jgi:ribonuclease P protein component
MRAYDSLQRQSEFSHMYRRGKRFVGASFVLYASRFSQRARPSKIGISVSKAVGKAVRRNLVRRRVQCAFDALGSGRFERCDLLVVAKPGAAEISYDALFMQLEALLRQAV